MLFYREWSPESLIKIAEALELYKGSILRLGDYALD